MTSPRSRSQALVWEFFRALADRGPPLAGTPGAAAVDSPSVELVRTLIWRESRRGR